MPETGIARIDIAVGHLDAAIQMVVDFGAFAAALTLAGAAEEMLGNIIAPKAMEQALVDTFELGPSQVDLGCAQRLLKRWRESDEPTDEEDIEAAAVCQILRALIKLDVLERRPRNWQRWRQWIDENWSDA